MENLGVMREERPGRPLDIYPAFREADTQAAGKRKLASVGDGQSLVEQTFLQVDTDEGVSGVIGPLTGDATAYYIATQLKPLLLGQDPLKTEYLWDVMYRNALNGRMGDNMIAISYIDYALWDIKGKCVKQPVHEMLGGPVQEKIPAYASTAGFSLEPEKAKERVTMLREAGFTGMKWFYRRGVADGIEGERANVALTKALREAAGPDMKIMIDAWANWGMEYTLRMVELLEEYNLSWIEEPIQYALHESYAKLRSISPIPIAGGEHEFTRWGAKALMDIEAFDIYQFEPVWAGGITEFMKIYALATAYDVTLVPHVYLPLASAQIAFTQNSLTTPMFEFHYILGEIYQFFLRQPLRPVNGYVFPPVAPGIGIEIDEEKVTEEHEITF
jgi:L-rhamnonate dehydratase